MNDDDDDDIEDDRDTNDYDDYRRGVGCGFLLGVLCSIAATLIGMVARGML